MIIPNSIEERKKGIEANYEFLLLMKVGHPIRRIKTICNSYNRKKKNETKIANRKYSINSTFFKNI